MRSLDRLAIAASTRALKMKESMEDALTSKKHGDSQVVVALILIVVAIGLAIIFRNQVNAIIADVADRVSKAVSELAAGATTQPEITTPVTPKA